MKSIKTSCTENSELKTYMYKKLNGKQRSRKIAD